jgi:hypothetical protein
VVLVFEAMRALGVRAAPHDQSVVPLTRAAFWERLARPDVVTTAADGSLLYRGLLPHLTWSGERVLEAGGHYWHATPERPELHRGRLVYAYRLVPAAEAAAAESASAPPAATAYADQVIGGVRREWDDLNRGFAWLTSLLSEELQSRAFDHAGGPAAARSSVYWTAGAGAAAAAYVLSFLPAPPGDPVGPALGALAGLQLVDSVLRLVASRRGRYAPSLWRFVIPTDILRPERLAYHAHRDAERQALGERRSGA